jgi:nucleoid-associated protein YgaU
MADVELTATKDFSYSTRRLKAGDRFTVPANMARVLVGIGKAEELRTPGRVAAPPPRVAARAAAATRTPATKTAEEAFSGFLDRPIAAISDDLPDQTDAQLRAYLAAERNGKSRKGLISAINAELDGRK